MAKVELHMKAPDFSLMDFMGNEFELSGMQGQKNVLVVFNRGFI